MLSSNEQRRTHNPEGFFFIQNEFTYFEGEKVKGDRKETICTGTFNKTTISVSKVTTSWLNRSYDKHLECE